MCSVTNVIIIITYSLKQYLEECYCFPIIYWFYFYLSRFCNDANNLKGHEFSINDTTIIYLSLIKWLMTWKLNGNCDRWKQNVETFNPNIENVTLSCDREGIINYREGSLVFSPLQSDSMPSASSVLHPLKRLLLFKI